MNLNRFRPEWKSAQVVMNDTNFLKKLQEYDKEHIPEERLQKLKPYLDDKGFDPAVSMHLFLKSDLSNYLLSKCRLLNATAKLPNLFVCG